MSKRSTEVGGRYAKYVLGVLVLVYVLNFIDRQILSILAEEIKADLGISDADIGFLYGTAFAVFYAVFGIPLGKLADVWVRKSLISMGLAFWSLMTALSGTARSFGMLATFRFGVGIGEASASPAAFSMLSDYFEPRMRATVLAIYSSGVYIGAGIGIFLGGVIVDSWKSAFPVDPPFGLQGWQAAFFAVGLPGLIMAVWVWMLREPQRGVSEGIEQAEEPHPFRETWRELITVMPPLTLYAAARAGLLISNLVGAAAIAALVYGLIEWLGSPKQWIALGIGVYAAFSWIQLLKQRDLPAYRMMFGSKAFLSCAIAFPCVAFVTYGIGFWSPPFMLRVHHVDIAQAGTFLGLGAALGGWIGVTLGGVLGDRLRRRRVNGRLYIGIGVAAFSIPAALLFLTTSSIWVAYGASFLFSIFSPMWIGPAASTINDLVLPRMRASASAFYILMVTFIGLALGPYLMGLASDTFVAGGMESGEALRTGMMAGLGIFAVSVTFLVLAMRYLPGDEASRLDRAREAGESI